MIFPIIFTPTAKNKIILAITHIPSKRAKENPLTIPGNCSPFEILNRKVLEIKANTRTQMVLLDTKEEREREKMLAPAEKRAEGGRLVTTNLVRSYCDVLSLLIILSTLCRVKCEENNSGQNLKDVESERIGKRGEDFLETEQ